MKNTQVILRVVWLFLLQPTISMLIAQQAPVFKHITVENGLSSGSVLSLAQDSKGFIWAGTMDGLNRYDGRKVKIFKNFYRDNFIGPTIKIAELCADEEGNLWIGTNNGLYVYNTRLDSFRVFYHSSTDPNSLRHNNIKAICLDSKKNIWIGSQGGVNIFTPTKDFDFHSIAINYGTKEAALLDVLSLFKTSSEQMLAGTANGLISLSGDPSSSKRTITHRALQGNAVFAIAEDKEQNIWAGTLESGVFRVDKNFTEEQQFTHQKDSEAGPASNFVRKIMLDKNGKLWIGTLKGLNIVDPVSMKFETYVHDPGNDATLNFNSIWDILQDRQGSMWVGTFFGGLNMVESISTPFTIYRNEDDRSSLSSNVVGDMVEDASGNLWIGTEAEGLNYFDRKARTFKKYRNDETDPASLTSNLVKTLIRDKQNNIWVGMHGGGINVLDASGKKIKEFSTRTTNGALNSNDVMALLEDTQGRVWAGTEGEGLNIIDLNSSRVEKFENLFPDRRLADKGITSLFRDAKNNIWIGTGHGLSKLQADNNKLVNYVQSSAPGQLLSDYVNCITEDKQHRMWIGTYAGLSVYDPEQNQFRTFTTADGLAGNKVVGILTDDHDNLWMSTNNGLSFLDSARKTWHSFTIEDGLPGNVFNYSSYFKDRNGRMYFGTYKGLVEFDPTTIQTNSGVPVVMLTGLNVNGRQVSRADGSGILNADISETKKIVLEYDQNAVTIDYAAMNFIKPGKNKSAYKLENYNNEWQYTDNPSASFNSLPPGHYRLLIKAANNDGVWTSSPIALKITILPPPWKTWWAYMLYALVIGLLAFVIIWFIASRTALRRRLKYEHMLNVKQEELHQMKMDFFTRISHEIRTPLTLIMGPVEMLLMKSNNKTEDQRLLEIVRNNGDRLLKLTTDLLEFRKVDSGHTQLTIEQRDIVAFVQLVFQKFKEKADRRSIEYFFESTEASCFVFFDAHHMEIVLSNLLSNALKFTPEGGKVWVTIAKRSKEIDIAVHDNGPGIPKESQDKIFTTFYQAGNVKHMAPGSGIGLAFSKSLVELHGGKLAFSSDPATNGHEQETCFTITLMLGKEHVGKLSS